jgi:hypothetical protein
MDSFHTLPLFDDGRETGVTMIFPLGFTMSAPDNQASLYIQYKTNQIKIQSVSGANFSSDYEKPEFWSMINKTNSNGGIHAA